MAPPVPRAAAKMGPPRQQWTKTSPPFLMAIGAPEVSQVSKGVQLNGLHEPRYTAYWQSLTARCCASGGLVVDVGANLGWFSLLSARMGCRVLAFEPVPAIAALFMASAKLNNLSHRIALHRAVASDDPTHQPVHLHFQAHSWDTSSIDGTASGNSRSTLIRAPSATLDAFVSESPCALKVDVEGYEPAVLRGGAASFKRYPPRVVMLEYTPGALERKAAAGHPNALDGAPAFPSMLRTLLHYGYRLYKLPERSKHRPVSPKVIQKGSLPALWELNATVLQVETANARRMQHAYTRCGFALPSELLPGSLRASFDYNTDVLAVRTSVDEAALLRSRGVLRAAKIKLPHARESPDRCVPPRGYSGQNKSWRQLSYCWWVGEVSEGCYFRQGHGLRILGRESRHRRHSRTGG